MISVCIPIYNYNVLPLVSRLLFLAQNSAVTFEIILADDGSDNYELKRENQKLKDLKGVAYFEMDKNVGRAAIRNFLADKAMFDKLLFLDCDTFPVSDNFLEEYLKYAGKSVVVGGISYRSELKDSSVSLRWNYGRKRESSSAKIRSLKPYASFMTGNFMIKRDVFLQIKFDDTLNGYGHEDTLFGISLKSKGIDIEHVDSPVYHDGLEANSVFMKKTLSGVKNLLVILERSKFDCEISNAVRLAAWYNTVRRLRVRWLLILLFLISEKLMLKHLSKKKPNLKVFDFYKLGYMCKASLVS